MYGLITWSDYRISVDLKPVHMTDYIKNNLQMKFYCLSLYTYTLNMATVIVLLCNYKVVCFPEEHLPKLWLR